MGFGIYPNGMRILLQRVSRASVSVDKQVIGQIHRGYLLFVGVIEGDAEEHAKWLSEKITKLRLFDADDGKINDRSVIDINGEILVISQFTLAGRTEKGNRPDYTKAAKPEAAKRLYEFFIEVLKSLGVKNVESGMFGAMMEVELTNDGPVTLMLDSKKETKEI